MASLSLMSRVQWEVNQRGKKGDTLLLQSWSDASQVDANAKRIDTPANCDTYDSPGFKVKANSGTERKPLGADIFIAKQYDLKSVRVHNGLLF